MSDDRGIRPGRVSVFRWCAAAMAAPCVLCALRLNGDLWYDEAYTLRVFTQRPVGEIMFGYTAPNNHILFTLILKAFASVSLADGWLRMPSFMFSMGTLVFVFRMASARFGAAAGAAAVSVLGMNQMFLNHATQARGYALAMFLAAILGDVVLRAPWGARRSASIAIVGGAFCYVIPSNVMILAALAIYGMSRTLTARSLARSAAEGAGWAGACLLAGLLYYPIADFVWGHAAPSTASPQAVAIDEFVGFYCAAVRDIFPLFGVAIIGAVLLLRRHRARRGDVGYFAPFVMCTATLTLPIAFGGLLRIDPFPRNFTPLLPFLAVLMGSLCIEAIRGAWALIATGGRKDGMAMAGILLVAGVCLPRVMTYAERLDAVRGHFPCQDGYYNYYAARFEPSRVCAFLEASIPPDEPFVICFDQTAFFCMEHYLEREGMPTQNVEQYRGDGRMVYYFVESPNAEWQHILERWGPAGVTADMLRIAETVAEFDPFVVRRFSTDG